MIALVALATFLTCAMLADSRTVILMIGPPGAGKTTQARKLSTKYKIPSVSMADLLKKNAGWGKMGSKKYSKAEVESGELADDQTADLLMPNDCCWMMHNPGLLWTGSAGGGIRNWVCTSGNRSMLHVFMSAGNRSAFQQLWYMAGCAANGQDAQPIWEKSTIPLRLFQHGCRQSR